MTTPAEESWLEWSCFVVDTKPFCMWGTDLPRQNQEFLAGIQPEFFEHVARSQAEHLRGEDRQHAALLTRLIYSQSLETMFALMAAAIQAPHCPLGWLLRYQTVDVVNVVRKLERGEKVLSRMEGPLTWDAISREIHRFQHDDATEDNRIKTLFATVWGS